MLNNTTKISQAHPKCGTGLYSLCLSLGVAIYLCLFCLALPVHADVIATGDVDPADPTTWTSSTQAYVGKTNSGTLSITDGSNINSYDGYLGTDAGSTGDVTVDGVGSTWTNNYKFYIGYEGYGTLNITGGGSVINWRGYIGTKSGSAGEVTVDGIGSLWTNSSGLTIGNSGDGTLNITGGGEVVVNGSTWVLKQYVAGRGGGGRGPVPVEGETDGIGPSGTIYFDNGILTTDSFNGAVDDLTGTGTINTHGLISDVDLVFDATHGLNQTFNINGNPGQNITVNLNVNGSGSMGAGYGGNGTMRISDGIVVESSGGGYIGYKSDSAGEVAINGPGSTWASNVTLYVGYEGSGTLNITGGGVLRGFGDIGYKSGSTGEVTVDGIGSRWIGSSLTVGSSGDGTLNIINGGTVTIDNKTRLALSEGSSGAIHFENGTLTTGSFFGASDDLTGTGTINTEGLVSDVDLVFDATHGLNQTLMINQNPGQNITVNLSVDKYSAMGVGYGGNGTMRISDGIVVKSANGYIGYKSGSTGEVTVDGVGSTWYTRSSDLYIGYYGSGILNIANGGYVVVDGDTRIAYRANSTGIINFDNGTLRTSELFGVVDNFTGTGTINTKGLVSDVDLVFDATHGSNQTFILNNNPDQNITINLNVASSLSMGAGYGDVGSMSISEGSVVRSKRGYIGYKSSSTGLVSVDGIGSTWANGDDLYVGHSGNGTLNITRGGIVNNGGRAGYIGYFTGSTGEVTVDGIGSTWINRSSLYVGNSGNGTLNITGGGLVRVAGTLTIDWQRNGESFINMASGGMLALEGDADDSLNDFLELINGTNAIRYWDDSISDWVDITGATIGEDYTLTYLPDGDLAGYTVLAVPELSMIILGDVNGDGVVDGFDVDPFVDVLLNGPYMIEADINQDGVVNGFDVDPFVTYVLGNSGSGGGSSRSPSGVEIPEPMTLVLMGFGGFALWQKRRA